MKAGVYSTMYGSGQVWRRPFPFFRKSRGGSLPLSFPPTLPNRAVYIHTHTSHKKQSEGRGGAAPHYGNTRNRTSVGRSVDRMTRPNRRYGTEEPLAWAFYRVKRGDVAAAVGVVAAQGFFWGGGRRRLLVPKGGRMGEGGRGRLHYRLTNEQ